MEVRLLDHIDGARQAAGVAVIIDVFRAFSVACYAMARGAATLWPVAAIEAAQALKLDHPGAMTIGERNGCRLSGFDLNNSPSELQRNEVAGRKIIHTTHAGTQGLMAATRADLVLTGALVNCAATVAYIQSLAPQIVSIVRMGEHAISRCDGDDICAEIFMARFRGLPFDVASIRDRLRTAPSTQRFFDPAVAGSPQADFDLCTATDCFDFALRLDREPAPARLRVCRAER